MGDLTKNFSRSEFACKCGCGFDTVDIVMVNELQRLRDKYGRITITSGCRCVKHNKAEGGGKFSQHLLGKAADFIIHSMKASEVFKLLDFYWEGGLGKYHGRTHIDSRNIKARWDTT